MKPIVTKNNQAYLWSKLEAQPFLAMSSESIKALGGDILAAIQIFCIECAYTEEDVRGCKSYSCPLWDFRPYKDNRVRGEDPLVPSILDLAYLSDRSKVDLQTKKEKGLSSSSHYFWWSNPTYANKTLRGDPKCAIHLKCTDCLDGVKPIRYCKSYNCTLWSFRPYDGNTVRPEGFLPSTKELLKYKDKHPPFEKPVFHRVRINKKKGTLTYGEPIELGSDLDSDTEKD